MLAPAEGTVEAVAARWQFDLFALPPAASVGFVTGGAKASFTYLAAARHGVLASAGWDVEARLKCDHCGDRSAGPNPTGRSGRCSPPDERTGYCVFAGWKC